MTKGNYFTIGALVIAILVLGVIGFAIRKPVVNIQPVIEMPMGAVSGPELTYPSWTVNGITRHFYREAIATGGGTATTTLCNFKLPTATSTIESFSINVTTGPTEVHTIQFAEGTKWGATTTAINTTSLIANVKVALNASSTATTALSGGFGISGGIHWLTARIEVATTTIRGFCTAVVREMD